METGDVILIKDEDDVGECGAVTGEDMHVLAIECNVIIESSDVLTKT